MFSTREREYLRVVASGAAGRASSSELSPGYRRKLQWSIRQKASRALSDWELYVAALEHEPRVLAPHPADHAPAIPVYTDPFITAARAVSSALGRLMGKPRQRPKDR